MQLMAATVDEHGVVRIADVAATAQTATQQWSVVRARLIEKGYIEPVSHGALRCSQPGFLDYVARQSPPPAQRAG